MQDDAGHLVLDQSPGHRVDIGQRVDRQRLAGDVQGWQHQYRRRRFDHGERQGRDDGAAFARNRDRDVDRVDAGGKTGFDDEQHIRLRFLKRRTADVFQGAQNAGPVWRQLQRIAVARFGQRRLLRDLEEITGQIMGEGVLETVFQFAHFRRIEFRHGIAVELF